MFKIQVKNPKDFQCQQVEQVPKVMLNMLSLLLKSGNLQSNLRNPCCPESGQPQGKGPMSRINHIPEAGFKGHNSTPRKGPD